MGVDTGKQLHVVILKTSLYERWPAHLVHLETCSEFSDLDDLMRKYNVYRCVIDGLPETHPTREFAGRHREVYMNFFNEHQRGSAKWDAKDHKVEINRTEALDFSRAVVREKRVTLPRQTKEIEEFAKHMSADAKILEENEETGSKKYKYIKTGINHYSFAFTYGVMAAESVTLPMSPEQLRHVQSVIDSMYS